MYCYLIALILSAFTLMMNLFRVFSSLGDYIFTDKKTWVCLCVSVIFIIIGLITDKREKYENN